MADPIVFDCGGSTRIKRILAAGFGDMPRLLDIVDLSAAVVIPGTGPLPPGARGSQDLVRHVAGNPFNNVTIMFQDASGIPFVIPVAAALPGSFVIASNLGQNVRGDFVAGAGGGLDLIITIYSTAVDPLVAAKQLRLDAAPNRGRRRYIVDNAGPIKTITLDGNVVYDSTNAEGPPPARPIAPGAVGPAGGPAAPARGLPLYVSVVVS